MERVGFECLAAIDSNEEAIRVLKTNFPNIKHALQKDLTQFSPSVLAELIEQNEVDVIVGGPPCQGFSTVRQRDGANSGRRIIEDPRRFLYQEFLAYVEFFRPKVFVMENVLGIKSAEGGRFFTRIQHEGRLLGYRVHAQVEKAYDLGVPQKRIRQLIIGTRNDLPHYFWGPLTRVSRAVEHPTLGEAISDLPVVKAGAGKEVSAYVIGRRKTHTSKYGRRYLFGTLEIQRAKKLTAHRARPHSERDLRDFAKLREGEHCAEAMKRGVEFEFPYNKETFKDRYTRQHRDELCSTIVAHLSKDGLMFIHPTQNRSLTPREAARIQSFPDWFEFPVARTHQFRLIGNAVPPLVSEAAAIAVRDYLEKATNPQRTFQFDCQTLPASQSQAFEWLLNLVQAADNNYLRQIPTEDFKRGWYSIGFLYAGLHPDSVLEHGEEVAFDVADSPELRALDQRLQAPRYVQSGWPLVLVPIAMEAWRRYEASELADTEFYCSDAVIAGLSVST